MIFAFSSHLGIFLMINILSLLFIAYGVRRLFFSRNYEDDVDKRVLAFFLVGLMLFSLSILADTLVLLGMNSYLGNYESTLILKTLAPVFFTLGAINLQRHK